VPLPVMASSTMLTTKPIMARRPHHCSAKGRKPKRPSSVGRPMLSANCVDGSLQENDSRSGGRS
jgi:hypothetical protein